MVHNAMLILANCSTLGLVQLKIKLLIVSTVGVSTGYTYGPKQGRRWELFIDDLHLPLRHSAAACTAHEVHSPSFSHLHPPSPTFTHLHHLHPPSPPSPTFTHLHPPSPTFTHLHPPPPSPTFTHLHPPSPTFTHLHPPSPTFTHLHPPSPPNNMYCTQ